MYVYNYVCMYVCMYVCIIMYVCMYVYNYVCMYVQYKSNSGTVKPVLSDHAWAKKKWSLNRGGLLIQVKMHGKATIGTRSSGP